MTAHRDCQWWNAHVTDQEAGPLLCSLVSEPDVASTVLRQNTRRLVSMFELGARVSESQPNPSTEVELDEREATYNVSRNLLQTMASKICKTRISPMVLTEGGGFMERYNARQADKAIEGECEANELDRIKEDVVTDALVTDHGAGAAMVYEREGKVCMEHVPIEDLRFDRREIRHRDPRCMYRIHNIDKYQAIHLFPKSRQAILDAAGNGEQDTDAGPVGTDRVVLYEAWHLPSGEGAKDGRHVFACKGATLLDEEWTEDDFPVALYVPVPRRRSLYGLSVMKDLAGGQREHEQLSVRFQNAHKVMGLSGFLVPKSASLNPKEISNVPGLFVEYSGQIPPVPFTPQPVGGDQYGYRESVARDMGNNIGVSQLAANSQLPAGLQQASGKALQVYEDFESERLMPFHRELERWHVRMFWLVIKCAKRIAEKKPDYATKYVDKKSYETVKWAKICKDADAFVLRVFPVSSLSKSPAARFAQLQELLNAEAITIEEFRRLYDLPDLEGELELETADTDIIDRMLEQTVILGKTFTPEPFDNLQLLIERGTKFYSLCRVKDVPEDRMQLLRNFIVAAKDLLSPPAPMGTAMPAGPSLQGLPSELPGLPPALPAPPGGEAPAPMMQQVAA